MGAGLERVRRHHRDDDLALHSLATFYGPRCEVGRYGNRACTRIAVACTRAGGERVSGLRTNHVLE
jgi:hypothetical protein